jgi:hypothetical protein
MKYHPLGVAELTSAALFRGSCYQAGPVFLSLHSPNGIRDNAKTIRAHAPDVEESYEDQELEP